MAPDNAGLTGYHTAFMPPPPLPDTEALCQTPPPSPCTFNVSNNATFIAWQTRRAAVDKKIEKQYIAAQDDLEMDSKSLKLEKEQKTGYYFKVSRQKDAPLRKSKHFRVLETRKDGVRFTNDALLGLNKTRRELHEAYEARQVLPRTKCCLRGAAG